MASTRCARESTSGESSDEVTVLEKTKCVAKKKRYMQKYKPDYHKDFPCIVASKVGDTYAFCTVCACDLKIAHGGRNDIQRHMDRHRGER